uniref:V-SNARE coiled-coil homology domain-containing protein n=1 Tax=viral metagenome TaxID=1070528 RepID=A0A6C0EC70_9ZZZZ
MSDKVPLFKDSYDSINNTYGSNTNLSKQEDTKIKETRAQVDQVVVVMKENVIKVMDRDAKLNDLEDKSEALRDGAARFENTARKLKWSYCKKNAKFWIILILVILIFIVIIAAIASQYSRHHN